MELKNVLQGPQLPEVDLCCPVCMLNAHLSDMPEGRTSHGESETDYFNALRRGKSVPIVCSAGARR